MPRSRRVLVLRLGIAYLAVVGVLAHVTAVLGVLWALSHFDLRPLEAVRKAGDRVGVTHMVESIPVLQATERFPDHRMDGRVAASRPRILLPELRGWSGRGVPSVMAERQATRGESALVQPERACRGNSMLPRVACWVATGDVAAGREALEQARTFAFEPPRAMTEYGNAWELALAVDLLHLHPAFSAADAARFEQRLAGALREYLQRLDEGSASLWHGRSVLAARAWLVATALGQGDAAQDDLVRRAQAHFLDVVRALALVEAWPEGYNYWINSRALDLTLALSAYMNGVEGGAVRDSVAGLLRRVGRWHVYATRPDDRIQGYGDEGSRVDLKDETGRVIDLIAQQTRDPVAATFSRYLESLHGASSYYRHYRWWYPLLNDPAVPLARGVEAGSLSGLAKVLPGAEVFGRGAMNLAYLRSGWGPEDTFITFDAGHSFTHHGHADAGHFTLYKGGPLAINSGTYGGVKSPHRLYYSMRTVAKNSLLVLRPGERVAGSRLLTRNVADGGQRLPIPTGSAVTSVADWRANLGAGEHFEGGRLEAFEHVEGLYTYLEADLTAAYNTPEHDAGGRGGKVTRVVRRLLYLRPEDRVVLVDDVVSTDPSYRQKWLLHTLNRPEAEGLRVLKGERYDGILETDARRALVAARDGRLTVDVLAPRDAALRLVGGPGHRFYVEVDGDDSDLDGESFEEGARIEPWFDVGEWRIEVQPRQAARAARFVTVLSPSLHEPRLDPVTEVAASGPDCRAYHTGRSLLVACDGVRPAPATLKVPAGVQELYVLGLPRAGAVELRGAAGAVLATRAADALAHLPADGLAGREVTVAWGAP